MKRTRTSNFSSMFNRPFAPARKRSFRVSAMVAQGMLRAARKAAENGKCVVAQGLFALSGFGSVGPSASTPRRYLKALSVGETAAGVASAIVDCHARARSPKESTS